MLQYWCKTHSGSSLGEPLLCFVEAGVLGGGAMVASNVAFQM